MWVSRRERDRHAFLSIASHLVRSFLIPSHSCIDVALHAESFVIQLSKLILAVRVPLKNARTTVRFEKSRGRLEHVALLCWQISIAQKWDKPHV